MRVGIDYLPASTHAPGLGRWVREVVRALVRRADAPELSLLELGRGGRRLPPAMLGLAGALRAPLRRRSPLGARVLALAGAGVDLWAGRPQVFQRVRLDVPGVSRAVSSLALAEIPPAAAARERLVQALRGVDHALVFSAEAARRLRDELGQPAERVHAVPVGCEHWSRELGSLPAPADPPEVLVLGAPLPGRRHELVLQAVRRLRAGGLPLVLRCVGRPPAPGHPLAAELASARGVLRWDDPADDPCEARLPALVARAALLVHLADDEVSAVTPLEACACGLPVVASDLPAFAEVLAGRAELLDETQLEVDVLADAIARALADRADAAGCAARRDLAARFSWDAAARATAEAWQRMQAVGRR